MDNLLVEWASDFWQHKWEKLFFQQLLKHSVANPYQMMALHEQNISPSTPDQCAAFQMFHWSLQHWMTIKLKIARFLFQLQHRVANDITFCHKSLASSKYFWPTHSGGGRPDKVHNNVVRPLSRILFLTTSHFYNLCHKVYHAEPCHCQPGLLKYSIFEYCKSPSSDLIVFNNKINTHPL